MKRRRTNFHLPQRPAPGPAPPEARTDVEEGYRGVRRQRRYTVEHLRCGCTVYWLTGRPQAAF